MGKYGRRRSFYFQQFLCGIVGLLKRIFASDRQPGGLFDAAVFHGLQRPVVSFYDRRGLKMTRQLRDAVMPQMVKMFDHAVSA